MAINAKTRVGGYLVDPFSAPCNGDTAGKLPNETCPRWKVKQDATDQLFRGEPFRIVMRKALAT